MRRPADFPRDVWREAVRRGRRALGSRHVHVAEGPADRAVVWIPTWVGRYRGVALDAVTGDPVGYELVNGGPRWDRTGCRQEPTRVDGSYPRWAS